MIPNKVKFCQVTASAGECDTHTSAPPGHSSRARIELKLNTSSSGSHSRWKDRCAGHFSAFGEWPGAKLTLTLTALASDWVLGAYYDWIELRALRTENISNELG